MGLWTEIHDRISDSWRDVRHVDHASDIRSRFHLLDRFLPLLRPHMARIAMVLSAKGLSSIYALVGPVVMKIVIDTALPEKNVRLLTLILIGSIGLWGVNSVISLVRMYLEESIDIAVRFKLRQDFFNHMQRLSLAFFDSRPTGDHMYRADSDISSVVQLVIRRFPEAAEALFHLIILGVVTFHFNWKLAVLSLTILPLQWVNLRFFSTRISMYSSRLRQQQSQVNADLQEAISSIRLVKAFGKEEAQSRRYGESLKETLITGLQSKLFIRIFAFIKDSATVIWSSGLTLYCGIQVISGNLTVGEMMALILYVSKLHAPIGSLISCYAKAQEELVAADRVLETLDVSPQIIDSEKAIEISQFSGRIEFRDVTFGYEENKAVIKDLEFIIEPRSHVAIVGLSGGGKSTIASLILRLYDPWEGEILLDDIPLTQIKLHSIREQIAIVPQDNLLLPGSIRDNIKFANEHASEDEIIHACKLANAAAFIERLPQQYDTNVAERGVRLSGGERQRIGIARALIKNPSILILDEPTSYQDPESEQAIASAIWSERHRTTLIISHRLETIKQADRIFVVEDGRVVESGSHHDLITAGGPYERSYSNHQTDFTSEG